MAHHEFHTWPKWDRETNFDQFLLEWNSICASRGDFKKDQKMALLAQALPRSMGADVQAWTDITSRTWREFIIYVKNAAKDTQVVAPYKLLKRAITSPTFKQGDEETLSAFYDRFRLKLRYFNSEATRVGKQSIEGAEQVELFEKNLLAGYRAALIDERYKMEDIEEQQERERGDDEEVPETKINLSWAHKTVTESSTPYDKERARGLSDHISYKIHRKNLNKKRK